MSDNCVKTENLSKRFFILQKEKTTFRALKALIKRESLKKEFWALRNISFEIKKGDKVAIIGKNGSGKTTLLRILTGIYDKTSGSLRIEGQPKALFSYWLGFNIDLSVIDNIYLCGAIHGIGRFFLKQNMSKVLEMTELYHLRFSPLKELSSGQQHRLAFTIFSLTPSDLLIFDDSLNFDQAFSQKCEPYFQNLFSSDKTIIMTSHNNYFLKRYCKTAIWINEGDMCMLGKANEVIGEYEKYFNTSNFQY